MDTEPPQLHVVFIPLMAPGHMIPMIDMAKLFSIRGVKTTILNTHGNAPLIQGAIDRAVASGLQLELSLVPFPSSETGLPEGNENLANFKTKEQQMVFLSSLKHLRQPFETVLRELAPNTIVSDMFFPWTVDIAVELGIPRILFKGCNFFAQCAEDSMFRHNLYGRSRDGFDSSFVLAGLPHRIEMLRSQIPDFQRLPLEIPALFFQIREAEQESYGQVVNSFCELEPDYVKYYKEVMGKKAWHIGPVSLCNKDVKDNSLRGTTTTDRAERHHCLEWLDSKEQNSVLYICFGSLHTASTSQLREIALGLEASNHHFLWVVKNDGDVAEWLPEGVEKMTKEGKGLILSGWVPQVLILNHSAIGGFMTHCGWNSCLEAICAGQPMITWPLFAEQFSNERFVVDVLKVGVEIGSKKHLVLEEDKAEVLKAEEITKAADKVMDGVDEAEGRRRRKRARELGEMAKRAMEESGSSYKDMGNLIEELAAVAKGGIN